MIRFLGVGTGVFLVCVPALRDVWLACSGIMRHRVVQIETPYPPIECINRSG